jgi:ubiquinone biosynthesis monooxygenase Coq7
MTNLTSKLGRTRTVNLINWSKVQIEKESFVGGKWPKWLSNELRSDHAGETGAVYIYIGAIWAMELRSKSSQFLCSMGFPIICPYHSLQNQSAYTFSKRHLETESEHLEAMEILVPLRERSALVPIWKLAGGMLGAAPVFISPKSTRPFFATIEAVETFVEKHYMGHITPLQNNAQTPELVKLLR